MSSEVSILAEDLSKVFRVFSHPRDRLLQAVWGQRRRLYQDFWALKGVSFSLARGETLGIVGRNGSGKSTLLQILCGIIPPSQGTCVTRGRIGALLELGSGFNPEFSGLENVYLNASLLGLKKREVEDRLDAILAFADIGDFIHQPVKSYSSGMTMRLAFAVQAHIDPEILVVDEALAVGDELFQKKCYAHLERLKEDGASILLVSHSCPQIVQHCDQALLLHQGRARMLGKPSAITVIYQRLANAPEEEWERVLGHAEPQATASESTKAPLNASRPGQGQKSHTAALETTPWLDPNLKPESTTIYPARGARIIDLTILDEDDQPVNVLPAGSGFQLLFDYEADQEIDDLAFGCHIASGTGLRISGQTFPGSGVLEERMRKGRQWRIRYRFHGGLWPGLYFIGGGIWRPGDSQRFIHRVVDFRVLRIIEDEASSAIVGQCNLAATSPQLEWQESAEKINEP